MLYPVSVPKRNTVEDRIGFIDDEGHLVVLPTYDGGSYFFEGKALVVDGNGKSGFIDALGRSKPTTTHRRTFDPSLEIALPDTFLRSMQSFVPQLVEDRFRPCPQSGSHTKGCPQVLLQFSGG